MYKAIKEIMVIKTIFFKGERLILSSTAPTKKTKIEEINIIIKSWSITKLLKKLKNNKKSNKITIDNDPINGVIFECRFLLLSGISTRPSFFDICQE